MDKLIFSASNRLDKLLGIITLLKISNLLAWKVFISIINWQLVLKKYPYIFSVVTKMLINSPIIIIAVLPAPAKMIMSGPNATFGKEFSTVKYGEIIFENIGQANIAVASKKLRENDKIKLIIISFSVTMILLNNVPSV